MEADLLNYIENLEKKLKNVILKGGEKQKLYTRKDELLMKSQDHPLHKGHEQMDLLDRELKRFDETSGTYRSRDQALIHTLLKGGICRSTYGSAFNDYEDEIKEYNGIKQLSFVLTIVGTRRVGKSWSLIIFFVVCLVCIENFHVIVIGPSYRSIGGDSGILGKVKTWMKKLYPTVIVETSNDETFIIKIGENQRKLQCYPGGAAER